VALTASMGAEIAGVFFGPLMLLLGTALLLTVAERGLAWDCLTQRGRLLTHLNQLGALRWGQRQLELLGDFRLRLVAVGVRGYSLEIVTAVRNFIVASGATQRSKLSPQQLIEIGAAMREVFSREQQREPAAEPLAGGEAESSADDVAEPSADDETAAQR
ncbi:MAG: hypothetical protein KC609_02715, partial [Myxococcales bacterium]|nr:hypothetical protein [Myxococcales bacterium]